MAKKCDAETIQQKIDELNQQITYFEKAMRAAKQNKPHQHNH